MASKLTMEWDDMPGKVTLHKKKGKITFDEVMQFFPRAESIITV